MAVSRVVLTYLFVLVMVCPVFITCICTFCHCGHEIHVQLFSCVPMVLCLCATLLQLILETEDNILTSIFIYISNRLPFLSAT